MHAANVFLSSNIPAVSFLRVAGPAIEGLDCGRSKGSIACDMTEDGLLIGRVCVSVCESIALCGPVVHASDKDCLWICLPGHLR